MLNAFKPNVREFRRRTNQLQAMNVARRNSFGPTTRGFTLQPT